MERLAATAWPADVAEVVRRVRERVCGAQPRAQDERVGKRKAEAGRR